MSLVRPASRFICQTAVLILCCAASAAAQQPSSSGPLVLEPMNSGVVLAPDVKFTQLSKETATLAGGYVAWVHDDRLLFGGAGYWRADSGRPQNFGYGGALAGWIFMPDQRFSVTAKGLFGFARLTTPVTVATRFDAPFFRGDDRVSSTIRTLRFNRDFFIAEPEIDLHFRLAQHINLTGGVSYRLVDLPDGLDQLARGPSGNVSVQFRLGK